MDSYRESAGTEEKTNPFLAVAEKYVGICRQTAAKLEEARQIFSRSVADYELADEAAFQAVSSADAAQKAYQAAHERMLALTAEEDSTKAASKMASTLADDALSSQIATDADYGGLMSQALEALMAVSANAEAELAAKRKAREEAGAAARRSHLEASSAHLSAQVAVLRRTQLVEQRVDAANRLTLAELEDRICRNREAMARKLTAIQAARESLNATISEHSRVVEEAQRYDEQAKSREALLTELAEKLALVGADIIPFETQVAELKQAEAAALTQYNAAMQMAEQAYYLQMQKTEEARRRFEAEQEVKQAAANELSALHEAHLAVLGEAAAQVEAARESHRVALEQARLAALEVERNDALVTSAREKKDNISASLDKARMTAGDTARMIASARAAKIAMKDDSIAVLSNAEAILQNTLQTAQALAQEKEAAYAQAELEFAELIAKGEKLRQAARRAAAAVMEAEGVIAAAETGYRQAQSRAEAEEQQRREVLDAQLNEARQATVAASEELAVAERTTAARLHEAEVINQRLTEISQKHCTAEQERDAKQQQINEINAAIEAETLQKTVDDDKLALSLWETGEKLRLAAQEQGAAISRMINAVRVMNRTEQTLLNKLSGAVLKCREKMMELSHNSSIFLDQETAARKVLAQDLADYQAACGAVGEEAEDCAAAQVAEMVLSTAEHMENGGIGNRDADYTLELEGSFSVDHDILLLPIPQIEGDPDIQVNPFYEPAGETGVHEGSLDLVLPDSGFQPPVAEPLAPLPAAGSFRVAPLEPEQDELAGINQLIEKQLQLDVPAPPPAIEIYEEPESEPVPAEDQPPAPPEQDRPPAGPEAAEDELDLIAAALAEAERISREAAAAPPPLSEPRTRAAAVGPEEQQQELNPLLVKIMAVASGNYQYDEDAAPEREIETIILQPAPVTPQRPAAPAPGPQPQPAAQPERAPEPQPSLGLQDPPEPPVLTVSPPAAEPQPAPVAANLPSVAPSLAYTETIPQPPIEREALKPVSPAGYTAVPVNDPLNSAQKATRLAEEINNLRSILAAQEEETRRAAAAQQAAEENRRAEAERLRAAEEAARTESARIRAEEESAQQAAEERAVREEAERQRQSAAEALRMARLAEEATVRMRQQNAASALEQAPSLTAEPEREPQPPAPEEEDDDDIESELRRLIFANLHKKK